MLRQQLLTVEEAERCAGCETGLDAGDPAWWDDAEHLWTCTDCVPTDESTRHSVGHAFVRRERSYSGIF
jgi:hypothetical protein